jgi:hypothetical protein
MQLLRLRYFQFKRDLGYWVPLIAAAASYISYGVAGLSGNHSLGLTAIVLAAFYGYQFNRNDHAFIQHYLDRPRQQILLNYNLLVLPVSLTLLAERWWPHTLLMHAGVTAISQLQPKIGGQRLLFIRRLVPAEQFEWISGLRKNFYVILGLYALALVLSPVKLFGLVALFLLNSMFLSFYGFCEPLMMLNPNHLNPGEFMDRKVNYSIKMLLLTNGPLVVVNALLHPESAWFGLCFFFAFVLLTACSVYIKYGHYRPNEPQGFHADFLVLFGSILVPWLLPLSIYLYYSNRRKAVANLSTYQHDNS